MPQQDTPLAIAKRRPACLPGRVVKPNPLPRNASLLLLIAANLLPVAGVLLWGWSIFEIVSLYWFENVVIGVINILKILTATGEVAQAEPTWSRTGARQSAPMAAGVPPPTTKW